MAHDIAVSRFLNQAEVATYATAIRAGGESGGEPIGVLAIFFNWAPQSATVVKNVRLSEQEWCGTRCVLLDSQRRVIAASDGVGILTETIPLQDGNAQSGVYTDSAGRLVAFARTPGYETYPGMGWYGVIVHEPVRAAIT